MHTHASDASDTSDPRDGMNEQQDRGDTARHTKTLDSGRQTKRRHGHTQSGRQRHGGRDRQKGHMVVET